MEQRLGRNAFSTINLLGPESRQLLNLMADAAGRVLNFSPGQGLVGTNNENGLTLAANPPPPPVMEVFPAKLTVNHFDGSYEYTEQEPLTDGNWQSKSAGANYGTEAAPQYYRSGLCWEFNKNATIEVPKFVLMVVKYKSDSSPEYRFLYCCEEMAASSSSSGSSGSSQGSSTAECTEVLKDVTISFNAQTCQLTVTKTFVNVAACPNGA